MSRLSAGISAASLMPVQAGGYQSAYQSALQQNQQLYQNVLGGYRDTIGQQRRETAPVAAGYGDLQRQVAGQYGGLQQQAAGTYQPFADAAYTTLGGGQLQNAYAAL